MTAHVSNHNDYEYSNNDDDDGKKNQQQQQHLDILFSFTFVNLYFDLIYLSLSLSSCCLTYVDLFTISIRTYLCC